ncbi:MAG: M23 family metallopeptidase [Candidatus Levyibacteriota bacterium]
MRVKLRPRFFIIVGCLVLGLVLFASNLLLKKRVEVKLVDESQGGKVLAADTGKPKDPYALIDASVTTQSSDTTSTIETYQPVTISYTVKEGDTLQSIAEKYHADAQTIADFPNNGLQDSLQLHVGQILIIPNGYIDDSQRPVLPPIAHGTGQFSWPAHGEVTQYAYYWHPGAIDIAVPIGTQISAVDDGTVVYAGWDTTGYGNTVLIAHGDGLTSRYAHLSEIDVTNGQGIHKGDKVGLSGSTGHSTGPHLHFEVRRSGKAVDPMTLLSEQ